MSSIPNGRRASLFAVAVLAFAVSVAFAQKGSPGGAPSSVSPSSPTRNPNTPTSPFPNSTTTTQTPGMTTPLYLSGKVMFDDGASPNSDIRIERVCGGNIHLEGYADRKGNFSLRLGQNTTVDTDAQDDSAVTSNPFGNQTTSTAISPTTGRLGSNSASNALWNCELRASYPGYRSDVLELSTRKSLDDPDVGTIVLHRLSNVIGSTLSLTTALAPPKAQKEYQKGLKLVSKGDFEEGEKHFITATAVYPKYAIAWCALGEIQQRQGRTEEARKSYAAAIAADNKYVNPYAQLALMSVQSGKWQDAQDYSNRVIQLNPIEFPGAFWLNALANYQLNKMDEAEKSAKHALQLDTAHKYPDAERLLGWILAQKGQYPEAAEHLRAYLALNPNPKLADDARQLLGKVEQAGAQAKQ